MCIELFCSPIELGVLFLCSTDSKRKICNGTQKIFDELHVEKTKKKGKFELICAAFSLTDFVCVCVWGGGVYELQQKERDKKNYSILYSIWKMLNKN